MNEHSRGIGWDTPGNAERYAAYAAKHPLYDATSRALVGELNMADGAVVADLGCGTGSTLRALLAAGRAARVFAVDSSRSQLELAKREIHDARVTFVHAQAEDAHHAIAERCDAVVCNAAVWQLKPPAVRAVASLLRAEGRFAFNLPAPFAPGAVAELCEDDPQLRRFTRRHVETLERAMLDEARSRFGFVPETHASGRAGFVEKLYLAALNEEGLRIVRRTSLAMPISHEAAFDWYMIPVFRTNVLRGMSIEGGEEVLRSAYAKWRPNAPETFAVWINFLAIK